MILNADPNGPNAFHQNGQTFYTQDGSAPKKLNFLGWTVLLLGLYALNGTSAGHEIIFYSMVLIVMFLFVYNYQSILSKITK